MAEGTYLVNAFWIQTQQGSIGFYGGFNRTESIREQRNWAANKTIVDGCANGCAVGVQNTTATIDGFTLQDGVMPYTPGGGISSSNCPLLTIQNNIIRGNTADQGGGLGDWGSTLLVIDNVFVCNSAANGAGIYCCGTSGQFIANTIICNQAGYNGCDPGDGGGVYLDYAGGFFPPDSGGSQVVPSFTSNIIAFNNCGGIYNNCTEVSPVCACNDVYGNGGYNYACAVGQPFDHHLDMSSDPAITNVDWGDYHIASTSPCRWAGQIVSGVSYPLDIDHNARTSSGTIDIGAEEWNGINPVAEGTSVFYVDSGGSGNGSGGWNNAAGDLQTAINTASAGGGQVWVTMGAYNNVHITLSSPVRVYGGFHVGDTSITQRSGDPTQTVLDGGGSDTVVTMNGLLGCAIDGLMIRNGATPYDGGGIYCSNSIPCINNCLVILNTAGPGGQGYGYPGGIYGCGGGISCCNSSPLITNCTISNNQSIGYFSGYDGFSGGCGDGIYCGGNSSPTISNCQVTSNTSPLSNICTPWCGAGIWCDTECRPVISGCTITNNSCHGIYCDGCPMVTISGNTIQGSHVLTDTDADEQDEDDCGGGIFCLGPSSIVAITNNTIGGVQTAQGNTASYEGGGIFCNEVTATIDSNLIENNRCGIDPSGSATLAFTMGGGLSMWNCPGSVITNNVFAYNLTNGSANDPQGGGGIYVNQATSVDTAALPVAIVNNTFVCNSSAEGTPLTAKAYGGAVQIDGNTSPAVSATILNNIFYGNLALNGNSVAFTAYDGVGAVGTISYCNACPGTSGHYYADTANGSSFTFGSDCLNQDPIFVSINSGNPASDNYHLSASPLSPCIDQGPVNTTPPYKGPRQGWQPSARR